MLEEISCCLNWLLLLCIVNMDISVACKDVTASGLTFNLFYADGKILAYRSSYPILVHTIAYTFSI